MKKFLLSCLFGVFSAAVCCAGLTMEIVEKSIICDSLPSGPAINPGGFARLKNGDLLLIITDSTDLIPPAKSYLVRSSDNGKTWSEPGEPLFENENDKMAADVCIWELPDGGILFGVTKGFYSRPLTGMGDLMKKDSERKILYGMIELYVSYDDGKTLTQIANLVKEWDYLIPSFVGSGTLLQLQNGDLLLPGYLGTPLKKGLVSGTGFWRSKDGGKTWGEFEQVFPNDKNFSETSYFQKDDGTIIGFARWDMPWYSNVADNGESQLCEELYRTESKDNGKTWSKPVPTNMLCIYPVATRLENGIFVIFGGRRDDPARDRICHIWASKDGDNFVDLGSVYYLRPEHRDGKMDSLWGTTGGKQAIYPLDKDHVIVGFNGGSIHELPPYYTYTESNIIKITDVEDTPQVRSENKLLNSGSWKVTGGKVETVMLDGEAVLKVTGPAVLESKRIYPVDPETEQYNFRAEFKSAGATGINYFGARCFKDSTNPVDPTYWTVTETRTVLTEPCRAEDTVLYVKDASKWWRSSYFRLNIGGFVTGRDLGIVRNKKSFYMVQLQNPCGVTAPAGTPISLQANGTADVYFGAIMRGTENWRKFDKNSTAVSHGLSPRHLRKGTKFVRILMKLNQDADAKNVLYIRDMDFKKIAK